MKPFAGLLAALLLMSVTISLRNKNQSRAKTPKPGRHEHLLGQRIQEG
jgi:hypothetical protein